MKYILMIALLGSTLAAGAQTLTPAEKALQRMHKQFAGKWYSTFTFIQTTESYRNDSLLRTTTWYEAIRFPDKFRIDFGLPAEGNAAIWNGDSLYRFVKGELKRTTYDKNDLLFLLGGMYFGSFEAAKASMGGFGFDMNKYTETSYKGQPVFIIGAADTTEKTSQLWYHKDKLVLLRMIKYKDGRKEEGVFENHVALGGGYTETKVSFYFNDKLAQIEYYTQPRANPPLDPRLFDKNSFGQWHWKE